MRITLTAGVLLLSLMILDGCGGTVSSSAGTDASEKPASVEPGGVFASDSLSITEADLLDEYVAQIRHADRLNDDLKLTAAKRNDQLLDQLIAALDEQLGILRAQLDSLRMQTDDPTNRFDHSRWSERIEIVKSLIHQAQDRVDELSLTG